MKYFFAFTLLFFAACKDNNIVKVQAQEVKPIVTIDTIDISYFPKSVEESLMQMKSVDDIPGDRFVVTNSIGVFEKGDVIEITTREGKTGYPFYEGLLKDGVPSALGYPHYWVLHKGKIKPMPDSVLLRFCSGI